jgi:UDP-galactopyranose mutase
MSDKPSIICISHLVWEQTLFQRPQQIMKRLAARGYSVTYAAKMSSKKWAKDIASGNGGRHASSPGEQPQYRNVPWLPLANRFSVLRKIDTRLTASKLKGLSDSKSETWLWLYHPDHLRFADLIPHSRLIYDVMDHFSGFAGSRDDVSTWEQNLLQQADVVFTGGRSIQEAIEKQRADAICYPSGIDRDHFAKARDAELEVPADIRGLSQPIYGYFGAIDERIDFDLTRELCRRHPNASVVFLGPIVPGTELNITEKNFHWLGPKPYAELPAYLKAFDVCLMPWVRSELTAHISPTKTPEYLAGNKPVVSISIPDVKRDYGDVVLLAEDMEEFIQAVEKANDDSDTNWAATLEGRPAARTWDEIADAMIADIKAKS